MGLKIIKLAVTANNEITTSPTVTRLFHVTPESILVEGTHKISCNQFFDDTGEVVTSLPSLNMNNSYFNVYINGVLQMDDHFAYTAGGEGIGSLLISVSEETTIEQGTPIILEIVNFNPTIKTTYTT
ncbi:DUF4183 domain-containing protein [Cytobacillus sp. Hz8]|uniref:DUF4183 domain-containing protein n=1 Tax=Cytobacillus sp. Hz8 TaxID=3347168 RepID=UPI0035D53AF7